MKIGIKGVIVSNNNKWIYEWLEMDATCPRDVENEIEKANGEDLDVTINSVGGDVFAGSEIYTMLMGYKGEVVVKIVGVAASAASIIAMAGDKVLISPTAEMMIHNITSQASGDYRDFEHESNILKDYNSTIANAYIIKTGMNKDELLAMMDEETWLTPEKALEHEFVDEIMFINDDAPELAAGLYSMMLPPNVIEKIRGTIKKPQGFQREKEAKTDILMARLNLLKLKGEGISG